MKKLVLIRHAKSSWEFNLEDRDRPLSKKGIKRIKQMAMHNPEIFSSSEIIFSSTANRATHTASILVNSLLISFKTVNLVEDLYTFEASKLIDFLKKLSDKYESVICVGHNPAFTDAASYLSNTELDYLPTSAWAKLEFQQSNWINIADGALTLGIPKIILK